MGTSCLTTVSNEQIILKYHTNVVTFNGILGRPESQTNVLVPSLSTSTLGL
jgi:hypothetical protein